MDDYAFQSLLEHLKVHTTIQYPTTMFHSKQNVAPAAPYPSSSPQSDELLALSDEDMAILDGMASDCYLSSPELSTPPEDTVSTARPVTTMTLGSQHTQDAQRPIVYQNKWFGAGNRPPVHSSPVFPSYVSTPRSSMFDLNNYAAMPTLTPTFTAESLLGAGEIDYDQYSEHSNNLSGDEYKFDVSPVPSMIDIGLVQIKNDPSLLPLGWSSSPPSSAVNGSPPSIDPSLLPGAPSAGASAVPAPQSSVPRPLSHSPAVDNSPLVGYCPSVKNSPVNFSPPLPRPLVQGYSPATNSIPVGSPGLGIATGPSPAPAHNPPTARALSFTFYDGDADKYHSSPSTDVRGPLTPKLNTKTPKHCNQYLPIVNKGNPTTPQPLRRRAPITLPPKGEFRFVLTTEDDGEELCAAVAPSGGRGKGKTTPGKRRLCDWDDDADLVPPSPTKTKGAAKPLKPRTPKKTPKGKGKAKAT